MKYAVNHREKGDVAWIECPGSRGSRGHAMGFMAALDYLDFGLDHEYLIVSV